MVMLWFSLIGMSRADGTMLKQYAQCAAATAVVMPITFAMGEALTGTSNQLVSGMLPSVFTGVMLPASVSVGTTLFVADQANVELDAGRVFGQTIGLNAGLYAGGTALGISTSKWEDRLIYGAISALLLPIPSMLALKSTNSTANLSVYPDGASSDGWVFNANFQHRF